MKNSKLCCLSSSKYFRAILSWDAEGFGNMASIISIFLSGYCYVCNSNKDKIDRGISSLAYGLFVPIFFINVGLSANVRQVPLEGLIFLVGMLVVVVISKLLGAGIGGWFGGFTTRESWQLGFGMIPRGEVVLIIAALGISEGLIDSIVFSAVILLVIITSLITPFILQRVFSPSEV
jgi:Kef-type K+ transport system membrane component KefB